MFDDRGHIDDLLERRPLAGLGGELLEQPEVLPDLGFRGGPLHLDHYPLAADQRGAVDLGDRAGGQRVRFDAGEHVLPRDLEFFLHHRHDLGLAQRRHVILEAGELVYDRRREQVRPGGQDLPELGERRPEFFQRVAEPPGTGDGVILAAVQDLAEAVLAEDLGNVRRPAQELAFGGSGLSRPGLLPGYPRNLGDRGVDDHDRAPGVMGYPVGNAAEQELSAVTHADVADYHQVDALVLAGPDDGIGRVRVVDH